MQVRRLKIGFKLLKHRTWAHNYTTFGNNYMKRDRIQRLRRKQVNISSNKINCLKGSWIVRGRNPRISISKMMLPKSTTMGPQTTAVWTYRSKTWKRWKAKEPPSNWVFSNRRKVHIWKKEKKKKNKCQKSLKLIKTIMNKYKFWIVNYQTYMVLLIKWRKRLRIYVCR